MLFETLLFIFVLHVASGTVWWKLNDKSSNNAHDPEPGGKCFFPGYAAGGNKRTIAAAASPQVTLEGTMLSKVFGASSGAGYALAGAAGYVTKVAKFAGALNGLGGVFGGLMYATEPTAADILGAVQKAIDKLTEVVNMKVNEMQHYVDQEIVELEKTLMERNYKKMFYTWSNCLLATSNDLINECMREVYWEMAGSEYSFLTYKDELKIGHFEDCLQGLKTVTATYDYRKRTALHYAVLNNRCDCIQTLLDNGADVNAKDKWDNTAFLFSVIKNRITCFEILLENNAAQWVEQAGTGITAASKIEELDKKAFKRYLYYENVARGQGSQTTGTDQQSNGQLSYAVDGFPVGNYDKRSCTHSKKVWAPWWKVQLKRWTQVRKVVITNRVRTSDRLNKARVRVWDGGAVSKDSSNGLCAVEGKSRWDGLGDMKNVHQREMLCGTEDKGLGGDLVEVYIPSKTQYLTLCEVEVYGVKPKFRKTAFELMAGGVTECAAGFEVEEGQCKGAYFSLRDFYNLKGPTEKLYTANKDDRPYGCSINMEHGDVKWNENTTPNQNKAASGKFRLICKKGTTTSYDKKFLLSLEVSLPVFREYANLVLMSLSTLVQTYDAGTAEHTLYSERLASSVAMFKEYANKAAKILVDGWSESTCPSVRSLKCKGWNKEEDDVDYAKIDCLCRTNRLYLETEKCKFHATSSDCKYSSYCDEGRRTVSCKKIRTSCIDNWRDKKYIVKGSASSSEWKDKARDAMITWIEDERQIIKTSIQNYWQNELLDLIPTWETALQTSSNGATTTQTKKDEIENKNVPTLLKMKNLAVNLLDEHTKKAEEAKRLAMKKDAAVERKEVGKRDAIEEKNHDTTSKEVKDTDDAVNDSKQSTQIDNGTEKKQDEGIAAKVKDIPELEKQLDDVLKDFMK